MRRVVLPVLAALLAFALFMPVVCAGSSDDPTLGCDTALGWTLPLSDGPEGLAYASAIIAAVAAFAVTRIALRRRPATSRS